MQQDTDAALLLLAAFLACTALFFGILQLDIDIGRDFVLADLLRHGKVLYRDVRSPYGPLAPWLHCLLFRICGPSVAALLVAGVVASLLIVLLTYLIARQILPPAPSAVAGLILIVHSVYSADVFGYATPYTFAATYGLLFSLLTLFASLRTLDAGSVSRWDFIAGSAAALALACKQEFAIISAVTLGAVLAVRFFRAPKRALPPAAASAFCYTLIAGSFAFLLFRRVSVSDLLDNLYPKESFQTWRHFYEVAGGWGPYFWRSTLQTAGGFLFNFIFVVWATCLIALLVGAARGERRSPKLFWWLAPAGLLFLWRFPYASYYPVVLHVVVLGFVIGGRVRGGRVKAGLLAFSAVVFLLRVLPLARDYAFGRMYFVPSLIVYLYLCYEIVAPRLARFFPEARLQGALSGVFVLCFVIPEFLAKDLLWARRVEQVWTERGVVRVEAPEAAKARVVLHEIRRYTHPEDRVLLVPLGAMYCFLTDRQPPSKHVDYTFGWLPDGAPEQEEIRRLSQTPPKLVVVDDTADVQRFSGPVSTFGHAYSVQLARWIHENYQEVRAIPYQGRRVHFLIPNAALAAAAPAPAGSGGR